MSGIFIWLRCGTSVALLPTSARPRRICAFGPLSSFAPRYTNSRLLPAKAVNSVDRNPTESPKKNARHKAWHFSLVGAEGHSSHPSKCLAFCGRPRLAVRRVPAHKAPTVLRPTQMKQFICFIAKP